MLRFIDKMRLYYRIGVRGASLLRYYRMIRYFILTRVLGKEIPWVMELSVTYRCQAKCVHCSASNYLVETKKELDDDEIRGILDQAVELGIPKIDFFGGEPMIRPGLMDLVAYGSKKGLYMSFTTNGWLLNREQVEASKKAGIGCINVSLDSTNPAEHDQLRKLDGLYDRVIDGIKHCKEFDIPIIISTYVTRARLKGYATDNDESDLTKLIDESRKFGAAGIRVLFPIISGEWEDNPEQAFTHEDEQLVINNIDHSFAFIEGAFSVQKGEKVCQALTGHMFGFTPYGDIQLCVAFPDGFGSIREKSLRELLDDMYHHPIYQANKNSNCCATKGLDRPC